MKFCDTEQLADLFDVHRSTVSGWIKAGMPIYERGKVGQAHKFKVADCIHWRNKRAVEAATGNTDLMTADEAKRRKLTAEAGLQEIELAMKQGKVVEIESVYQDKCNENAELRSSMLNIPNRIAMQCVGETEAKIHKIMTDEIIIALRCLSDD